MVTKAHSDPPSRPKEPAERDAMPAWFVEAEEAEKSGAIEPVSPEETAPIPENAGENKADSSSSPEEAPEDQPAPPQEEAQDASETAPEAAEEIEDLQEALAEVAAEGEDSEDRWRRKAEENHEKWMRAMAELENFRKRSRREIESSINFANAHLLRELLDVLDDFERAQSAASQDEEESKEAYREGIRLIYQRFVEVLRRSGLERIPAKGEVFDPNLHEAISQIETNEVESGQIAHVVQQGYRLKDMVLRPAKVVVAK